MNSATALAITIGITAVATGIYLTVEAINLTAQLENALKVNANQKFSRTLHQLINQETLR